MCTAGVFVVAAILLLSAGAVRANPSEGQADGCFRDEVLAHVRAQFAVYGPLSVLQEFFGFIYVHEGVIGSAVTRSGKCRQGNCLTDTRAAAERIPRRAKVLGEWHTHPHDGSVSLSEHDVQGARNNRHIRCYTAFYSRPDGEILSWQPAASSVPTAMASRVTIGNYRERLAANFDEAPHE